MSPRATLFLVACLLPLCGCAARDVRAAPAAAPAAATANVRAPRERVGRPFPGVRHIHRTQSEPRLLDMHIVEIDLTTPGLRFRFTESNGPDVPGDTTAETTRDYLERVGARVAINAASDFADAAGPQYRNNYYVSVSDGVRVSPFKYGESAVNVGRDNVVTVVDQDPADRAAGKADDASSPPVELYNAIGAKNRILAGGKNVGGIHYNGVDCDKNCSCRAPHPRTAVGVSGDGKRMLILVVDGRRPGHSMGMTTAEVAGVLLEYGATDAVNLDGGGSTTLVFADPAPRVVNRPSDGRERAVGGNLAILLQP